MRDVPPNSLNPRDGFLGPNRFQNTWETGPLLLQFSPFSSHKGKNLYPIYYFKLADKNTQLIFIPPGEVFRYNI